MSDRRLGGAPFSVFWPRRAFFFFWIERGHFRWNVRLGHGRRGRGLRRGGLYLVGLSCCLLLALLAAFSWLAAAAAPCASAPSSRLVRLRKAGDGSIWAVATLVAEIEENVAAAIAAQKFHDVHYASFGVFSVICGVLNAARCGRVKTWFRLAGVRYFRPPGGKGRILKTLPLFQGGGRCYLARHDRTLPDPQLLHHRPH